MHILKVWLHYKLQQCRLLLLLQVAIASRTSIRICSCMTTDLLCCCGHRKLGREGGGGSPSKTHAVGAINSLSLAASNKYAHTICTPKPFA